MTEEQIQQLLSTKSETEWNAVCDEIKRAHSGDYPSDWYTRVIIGGVINIAKANWNK